MRDRICRLRRRFLERIGLNRGWFHELSRYYRGMTQQEFWVRYAILRMEARKLWTSKLRETEAQIRSYYAESDYWVLRQMYYHRHHCFHRIAQAMTTKTGEFCEYGCGVAPVTAWLWTRFPDWQYTLVDVPSPMLDFARWRIPRAQILTPGWGDDLPLRKPYDVIICLEVFEHVPNPLAVARHLIDHLGPRGVLLWDFVEDRDGQENLPQSQAERLAVMEFLQLWPGAHRLA